MMRLLLVVLAACTVETAATRQALDMATPWQRVTIADSWTGADGVYRCDLGVVTAWEESSIVTLHAMDDSLITSYAHPAAEDALCVDLDEDGHLDLVSAGEDKRIRVRWGPDWTLTTIDAATNVQLWMTLAVHDGCLVAGGRRPSAPAAVIARLCSETPRIASSWTLTPLGPTGWTMSIVPVDVDRDGDSDLVVSDRTWFYTPDGSHDFSLIGSRWLEAPTWESHTIHRHVNEGEPKMLYAAPGLAFDTASNANQSNSALRFSVDGRTWGSVTIPQPVGVGHVHAVAPGDIDRDGELDLVFTYSAAAGDLSGVVWLRGPTWTRGEISGPDGDKFDNLVLHDMDGDGDLDVLTTCEQLGLIWYENPTVEQ